ncbi:MAG TPA: tRNA pseudouridine(55) synthase TruB [Gemmataceae bacterium]|nr:tRNA pseudouridine(55) synthase TruB [Gemmataceae bacterium]
MPSKQIHGLLAIDKPGGMTSRDALDRALSWFPRGTKAGHTGTLDPLATGVLVLCLGAATRLTEYVQDMGKTYRAGVRLGARSDTDDADGTVALADVAVPPDGAAVEEALRAFVGEIEQVPPAYSAAKVSGQRAYDLARRGRQVTLEARRVRVHGIDVLACDYPRLEIEVRCGKGTYIRSLARDLGERLGCGGYVETLRRMRVGPFRVEEAVPLDADGPAALAKVLPVSAALAELPRLTLDDAAVTRLRQGQGVPCGERTAAPDADETAVFDARGGLVAVARIDRARRLLLPEKVFPAE